MKSMISNERGETPLEVGFYVLFVLLGMAFLMTVWGAFLDQFSSIASQLSLETTWGVAQMDTYLGYVSWAYRIPIIFIIIVLIWGVRAVIRKHTYTTGQNGQQYMNSEEEF